MKKLTVESFECPKCHYVRKVESLGHAVRVPCNKCGATMRKVDTQQTVNERGPQ